MYVKLDKQKMELLAICGILEDYSPSDDVKQIHERVNALKDKMDRFMKRFVEPELAEIDRMIEAENAKFIEKPE